MRIEHLRALEFSGVERRLVGAGIAALFLAVTPQPPSAADWLGYEKLTREQVVTVLAKASSSAPASFYSKNLSNLDLSRIDFKGANLSAAVLNGSNLSNANFLFEWICAHRHLHSFPTRRSSDTDTPTVTKVDFNAQGAATVVLS